MIVVSLFPGRQMQRLARWLPAVASALFWPLGLASCAASYPPAAQPAQLIPEEVPGFITPEEVAIFIGHEGVSFLDARPRRMVRRGAAPGAVQVDWLEFAERDSGGVTGRLDADSDFLAKRVGAKGVKRGDWVILFGDPAKLWGEEGRIAWMLTTLGQRAVSIVDGGFPAWEAAGLPVQRGTLKRAAATYEAAWDDRYLARKQDLVRWVEQERSWDRVLLDVRDPGEFRGAESSPTYGALRRGHIPGAVNVPWNDLLDEQGKLLPRDRLGELLLAKGVRPDAHIITYCTGGVRSAHSWFVLRSLGYPSVRNYAGSWWEWSVDRKLPAEGGGERPLPPAPPWPPEVVRPEPASPEATGSQR